MPKVDIEAESSATPAQFIIPATVSLQEKRLYTLKHGDTFAVFDHSGDAISNPGSTDGIFHNDTRYLSHFYLTIDGKRPILLSSTLGDDNAILTCDVTNPDLCNQAGQPLLPHDLIHMRRSRFLWNGTCFERLAVRNFDPVPHRISIEITSPPISRICSKSAAHSATIMGRIILRRLAPIAWCSAIAGSTRIGAKPPCASTRFPLGSRGSRPFSAWTSRRTRPAWSFSKSPVAPVKPPIRSVRLSSRRFVTRGAHCGHRLPVRPRWKHRTRSSTRLSDAACPTFIC